MQPSVPAMQQSVQMHGEYGLFVKVLDRGARRGIEVRWITQGARPGRVRALIDGEVAAEVATPESRAHFASFDLDDPDFTLEYGAADADGSVHRTRILRSPPPVGERSFSGIDSVYVVGDVHGRFDRMLGLLANADLVDDEGAWTGGTRHLVLTGDLFDRGDDVIRVLWFLYRLEREAAAAGGRVHVVYGNHEAMAMANDTGYVAGKEKFIAQQHGVSYGEMFDPHTSVLGRWLATKPALIRIEDVLLAHGGVSPTYVQYALAEVSDSLRRFITEPLFIRLRDTRSVAAVLEFSQLDSLAIGRRIQFLFSDESVLWYRAFVRSDTLGAHLDAVLDHFDSTIHVIGHTPVPTIEERYDGRLIAVDLEEEATELLLLARDGGGEWERYRIRLRGPPERL